MSATEAPRETAVRFGGVCPVLPVRDLAASLGHYVRVLGFTIDWEDGTGFASVSRGRCTIFLCEGEQGHPGTWIWIGVDDADRVVGAPQRLTVQLDPELLRLLLQVGDEDEVVA